MLTVVPLLPASTLTRDRDPVVLTGDALPTLQGTALDHIATYRWDGAWTQIPMQIDERKIVDFGDVYNLGPQGVTTLAYADPNTYTGPDSDPTFDADDELVVMAIDAGPPAPSAAAEPPGIVSGSGLELEIFDPLDGGVGYIYLFETTAAVPPVPHRAEPLAQGVQRGGLPPDHGRLPAVPGERLPSLWQRAQDAGDRQPEGGRYEGRRVRSRTQPEDRRVLRALWCCRPRCEHLVTRAGASVAWPTPRTTR